MENKQKDAERKKRERSLETTENKQKDAERKKRERSLETMEHKRKDAERKKTERKRKKSRKIASAKKGEKWEDIETAKQNFQTAMQDGPSYVCTVCHRLMYKCSVKHISAESLETRYKRTARSVLAEVFQCHENYGSFVCNTCDCALLHGKIPAQAKINGLQLDTVPEELRYLTPLERQLISTRIPFMKIVSLPRGRQCALHGPVVNVPATFDKICTLLPRIPKSAGLLRIKLKRQLKYKGHCMYQMVRPEVIKKALEWLQANNILYKDVTENYRWQEEWSEQEEDLWHAMTSASVDESTTLHAAKPLHTQTAMGENREQSVENYENLTQDMEPDEDDEDQTKCDQPLTNNDSCTAKGENKQKLPSTSAATSDDDCHHQEDQVALDRDIATCGNPLDSCFHVNNIESKTISIAPAEGETPLPIFLDEVFEEGCNPDKYPYGRGGLTVNRKTKITAKNTLTKEFLMLMVGLSEMCNICT